MKIYKEIFEKEGDSTKGEDSTFFLHNNYIIAFFIFIASVIAVKSKYWNYYFVCDMQALKIENTG